MLDISAMQGEPKLSSTAKNILAVVDELGLTPTSFALKAGLSRSFFSDLKRGRANHPRLDTLQKIADTAGVPVQRLTEGTKSEANAGDLQAMIDALGQLSPEKLARARGYVDRLLEESDLAVSASHLLPQGSPERQRRFLDKLRELHADAVSRGSEPGLAELLALMRGDDESANIETSREQGGQ